MHGRVVMAISFWKLWLKAMYLILAKPQTARLEACKLDQLKQAYQADWESDVKAVKLPEDLAELEPALLILWSKFQITTLGCQINVMPCWRRCEFGNNWILPQKRSLIW
jgi:hypothetical protein